MPHEQITPRQPQPPTPRTPADTGWFADYSEVVTFGRVLAEADTLTNARDVLDYFDKPWARTPEYEAWTARFRPLDDSDPNWDGFYADLIAQYGEN